MLSNLQLLRAFASIAVVLYHTGYFINGMHTEFSGVAIFFCLSGFMMAYVSRRGAEGFLLNRVIRIVPMYWCATAFLVIWVYSGLANPVVTWPLLLERYSKAFFAWAVLLVCGITFFRTFCRKVSNDEWPLPQLWLYVPVLIVAAGFFMLHRFAGGGEEVSHFIKSLSFIPYLGVDGGTLPILGVGWTLNIEMVLYVLFSICLLLSQRWAPSLVVAAIFGAALLGRFFDIPVFMRWYVGSYTNAFASGIVIFYVWQYWLRDRPIPKLWAKVTVALYSLAFFSWHLIPSVLAPLFQEIPLVRQMIGSLIPESVMIVALLAHDAGVRVSARIPMLLGAASYSIYLTHGIVLETIRPVGEHWKFMLPSGSFAAASFAVIISVIVGVAAYRYVELPMLEAYRAWLRRRRGAASGKVETCAIS